MILKPGVDPVNPVPSTCVNPKEPGSAGKIVNVMVRRFR